MNADGRSFDRRTLLRATAAVATAAATGRGVVAAEPHATPTTRATVRASCTGCTGCALGCPTAAIIVVPGGIAIDDAACVQCGYCAALCPVDGIRINPVRLA